METIGKRIASLAIWGAAAVLAACGGGSSERTSGAMPGPQAALVSEGAVLGAPPARATKVPLAASTLTATQLLDWAELSYPQYFAAAGQPNQFQSPYTFRYYPDTQNYLGVSTATPDDVAIYVYGPVSGGAILRIGALSAYECAVLPQNCGVPGAPTIGAATAGNASASIAFTAPASGGGSAISRYDATCISGFALHSTGTAASSPITVSSMNNGSLYSCTVTATNSFGTGAASAAVTVTPSASTGGGTGTSTTSGVACAINASVFNATINLTATVAMSCSGTQRTMTGNGLPDHAPGTFPNANNPNTIAAQTVNFSASLTPTITYTSGTAVAHVTGYANNSVKFDPATAESYNNAGVWSIEAIQSYLNLGLDSSNAHVQPGGGYHYHGIPEGYVTRLGKGTAMTLVGFALDGFPVYARYGYTTATNASSAIKVVTPSWRVKTTADAGRPSAASVPMGTFTQDYEYVEGLGDLDQCNGRYGVTPEFPNGIYHYYLTETFPYIQRCMKGTAVTGGGTGGTGGGGGGGPPPPPP